MLASCDAGVKLVELPNGDIIELTARFSFDGVDLLKENVRPTCKSNIVLDYSFIF